jgi:hypothetical protein
MGYDRVVLHASQQDRALYESIGFEPTSEMVFKFWPTQGVIHSHSTIIRIGVHTPSVYAFKDSVYLVIGVAVVLFGSVVMTVGTLGTAVVGLVLVLIGISMATFAAYQMGLSSKSRRQG